RRRRWPARSSRTRSAGASMRPRVCRWRAERCVVAVDLLQLHSRAGTSGADGRPAWPAILRRRVGSRALAVTTRQLATMVGAGLPIVHGLQLLAEQAEGATLRRTLRDLAQHVAAGST